MCPWQLRVGLRHCVQLSLQSLRTRPTLLTRSPVRRLHLFHLGAAREFECMVEQIEYEDVLQGFGLEAEKVGVKPKRRWDGRVPVRWLGSTR